MTGGQEVVTGGQEVVAGGHVCNCMVVAGGQVIKAFDC